MNIRTRTFAFLLVGSLIVGCGSGKLSANNVDKITEGMARAQVEDILGKPDTVDTNGLEMTCSWKSGGHIVVVLYSTNWEVVAKEAH